MNHLIEGYLRIISSQIIIFSNASFSTYIVKPILPYPKPILCNVLKELCAIRDYITTCDIASITDIIAMIEDIR